ncbi:nickel-dependent lactate racemase [Ruminococcaceae bacterium OttesenSCG-928-L11]|nr:nickel-dependent lactate racemase [Ruminococcaceae bacterium OttesenSCG-928-L11]
MGIYTLPYGNGTVDVTVEDSNLLYYAAPVPAGDIPDRDTVIREAFDSPIGTPPLEKLVTPEQRIAILLDDITRPTPKRILLQEVLRRLKAAGVPDTNITLIMALGTHRVQTNEEIDTHFGLDIIEKYRFFNLDYKDESVFVDLGTSENGTPIQVYRAVVESDFKIAIGNIVPHIAAGWGGGCKMIQPGVCSERTTEVTHLMACTIQNVLEACGTTDNACRREMEQIAGQVGLDFIVNTVLDEHKNILGLFCGHCIEAHRAGVALATTVMRPQIPGLADIVIASANPADIDFWQGCKPYIFSHFGVRDGGVIVFLIHGREGLCGNAPQHEETLRKYCAMDYAAIKADVDNGSIRDIVGINVPLFVATVADRVTTLCVSEGFSPEDIRDLGFTPCATVDAALEQAYRLVGNDATVGIIPFCGETLVRL